MDFIKQSNKNIISYDSYSNITIFKDESFNFLYKKTERISTAIYLITNLMNPEEPIKWQLRKSALGLLDKVMSLSNVTMSSRDIALRDISQKLFQLISLYGIAFRSGFVSEMNYTIVDNEMKKIADFMSEFDIQDNNSRNNIFDNDFFTKNIDEVDKEQIKKDISVSSRFNTDFDKGHYKRQEDKMSFKKTDNSKKTEQNISKTNYSSKGQYNSNTSNKNLNSNTNNNLNKNNNNKSQERNKRREDILNIIRQKNNVSVKDISSIIKDTSEKTIQRELVSMVEENVLLKEGERRWSRYMINQ